MSYLTRIHHKLMDMNEGESLEISKLVAPENRGRFIDGCRQHMDSFNRKLGYWTLDDPMERVIRVD